MGSFEVVEHKNDPPTVTLNADNATLSIGTQGINGGNIALINWEGKEFLSIDGSGSSLDLGTLGKGGSIRLKDYEERQTFWVDGSNANLHMGSFGNAGNIYLKDELGRSVFHLDGPHASLNVGFTDNPGNVKLMDGKGIQVFQIEAQYARLQIGAKGNWGDIKLKDAQGREVFRVDGSVPTLRVGVQGREGNISVKNVEGKTFFNVNGSDSVLNIGATFGKAGLIKVKDNEGREVIQLKGQNAAIYIGNKDNEGDIVIKDDKGNDSIHLNGGNGSVVLRDKQGKDSFYLASNWVDSNEDDFAVFEVGRKGQSGRPGFIRVMNADGEGSVSIDGKSGDIWLANADCAEEFEISESEVCPNIESGTVMILDESGKLSISKSAYDTRVAGVISGAGSFKPAIILHKSKSENKRLPLALVGKVYCKVDADKSSITAGDMLTTSNTSGHAMKAEDTTRSFGAIIGKALSSLKSGRSIIPILVSLQ